MTEPRVRGLTRARHLHVSPELHKQLAMRAKQWHWPNVSQYVEHELRRLLALPTEGFERVTSTAWSLKEYDGKHCIFVQYLHELYVFRYAQPTSAIAEEVLGRLRHNFGKPAGVLTDLAANYWQCGPLESQHFHFMQRTTQKNSWYIMQPEVAP